jgi:hypothetical protein
MVILVGHRLGQGDRVDLEAFFSLWIPYQRRNLLWIHQFSSPA